MKGFRTREARCTGLLTVEYGVVNQNSIDSNGCLFLTHTVGTDPRVSNRVFPGGVSA